LKKFFKEEKLNYALKEDTKTDCGVVIKKGQATYLGSLNIISELLENELTIAIAKTLYEGGDAWQ
jgi:hypothetical protein